MAVKEKKNAHLWEREPNDWYIEPGWVWERFFEQERFEGEILDPSCGMGTSVLAARAAGYKARGHDLVARFPIVEKEENFLEATEPVDNICTNPPFGLCLEPPYPYVEQCMRLVRRKFALILESRWIFGEDRSHYLETLPIYRVYKITPKPSMPPGPVIMAGVKPNSGTQDYVIVVCLKGFQGDYVTRTLRKRSAPKEKVVEDLGALLAARRAWQ